MVRIKRNIDFSKSFKAKFLLLFFEYLRRGNAADREILKN